MVPVSVSVFLSEPSLSESASDGYIKGLQIQLCVERAKGWWLRVMRLMVGSKRDQELLWDHLL